MRFRKSITIVSSLVMVGVLCGVAPAQMFGQRQLGRPLSRGVAPGIQQQQQQDVGTLQGNERYLRRNRRATDFVGPDLRELSRFIGVLQSRGLVRVPPATMQLRRRIDRSETINQPLAPASKGRLYDPRLAISFSVAPPPPDLVSHAVVDSLVHSSRLSDSSRIEVSMEGRTAILRGEVPSEGDRDLAELLTSFEPGISTIRNELHVNPQLPRPREPSASRRSERSQKQAWITLSHGSSSMHALVHPSPKARAY